MILLPILINRLWIDFAAYGLRFCRLYRLRIDFLLPITPTDVPPAPPLSDDGAEVAETMGLYLLSKVVKIFPKSGLYRDGIFRNLKYLET